MNEVLRRAAAHVVVDDVDVPFIDDATSHHLGRVLRVRDGDPVTATDGAGRWRLCRWAAGRIEPDGAIEFVDAPSAPATVAVAIPKGDRPAWLVQKATELGVDRLVLLHTDRSVVRWDGGRAERHLAKLRRVAVEASMQSRRVRLPVIEGPVDADAVLGAMLAAEPGGRDLGPADRAVAVGPEGGWSDRELARAAGTVGLGPTILRVETAVLAVCARLAVHAA